MKKILYLFPIVLLFTFCGCNKDDEPSVRELLTSADGWELISVSEDPDDEYEDIVELIIYFYLDNEYEYYVEFDDTSWEEGSGDWTLSGTTLELVDDELEFSIQQINSETARFKDNDSGAVLNFEVAD